MLKNPFDVLTEIGKKKVESDGKRNEFIHAQSDSLVTWLVGFAFTALCFISVNIGTIKTNIKGAAKPIIISLFLTIIVGLIFRYVSYLITLFNKDLEDNYLAGVYGDWEMMPIEPDEEVESADYDLITKKLKEDFGEEISFPRELNNDEKETKLPKLIEHYKALCAYSKKQYDVGINHLSEIYETAYKIKKQKTINQFKKIDNVKIGYSMVRWVIFRSCLYLLCILSFIIAISISVVLLLSYL